MTDPIPDSALDAIFRTARSYSYWDERSVSETLIRAVYDLMRYGPTSANCSPARFVFVTSKEAKARLEPHLASGNVRQTMSAPMTAIIAHDMRFYEHLPKLYPHTDAASWFTGNEALIEETAFRNGALQGAYLMIAARALGLDCGPMSGFDQEGVDKEFFPEGRFRSNFLCNIGYGDASKLHPRSPRLEFEEACKIL